MDIIALFEARKIFKQVYPATYNFKDEADGTSGTAIGFVDAATLYNGACIIVSDWQSHRKVLRIQDDATAAEDPTITHNITQATSGTHELWVGTDDVTESWVFGLYEGTTRISGLWISASTFSYRNAVDAWEDTGIAAANDTLYHIKIKWTAGNLNSIWINGVLAVDGIACPNNQVSGIDNFKVICLGDSADYFYLDAYGEGEDTDYAIGDNCFWRHYGESAADSFEEDDVGTQGTAITWVDAVDTAASTELFQEFNEHKKILGQGYTSAAGGYDFNIHSFVSQSTTGWFGVWVKTTDITAVMSFRLFDTDAGHCVLFAITSSQFQIQTGGVWRQVTGSPIPVNDTWYHIYIQWYADNTFDLWIGNVQYEDGTAFQLNMVSGINQLYTLVHNAAMTVYIDAPISSLDGDLRGDNRIFDYKPQTYNDITSNVVKCEVGEVEYEPSTANILDDTQLSITDLHIIQLYDENSDLRFEGLLKDHTQHGVANKYYLQSLNYGEMNEQIDYTAAAAGDVNFHLLLIHTNVGQEDGRLIYYTEDDPAGDITPNYRNRPTKDADRWLAAHGNKVLIIKPNGVCFLDDDRNPSAGAATITEASTSLMGPLGSLHNISNQINRVEVFGAIDPDTGTPFNGLSEDTDAQADGTGILKYYKRFRELQSDTDCQNRAIAIRTGSGFNPQLLTILLKSIYALPGEIINFAYADRSFSATDCYVESAVYNLVAGLCAYSINTGIFDAIGTAQPQFTYAGEGSDDVVETLRATDINTIDLVITSSTGVTTYFGWFLQNTEKAYFQFYLPGHVDPTRDITLHLIWFGDDGTTDGEIWIVKYLCDGNTAGVEVQAAIGHDIIITNDARHQDTSYIIGASDVDADTLYTVQWESKDAVLDIVLASVQLEYYIKRSV